MKYKIGDTVFHKDFWHQGCKGYKVLDTLPNFGGYLEPQL